MTQSQSLAKLMQQMSDLVDPYLGTLADREVPGKFEASMFARHPVDDKLFYDIGNNAVSASVSPRGALRRAQIFTGVCDARVPRLPGVWHGYEFINFCHDAAFSIETDGGSVSIDKRGLNQETSLVLGALPLTQVEIGALSIRQVVMAPFHNGERLRALLVLLQLDTDSEQPVVGAVKVPPAGQGEVYPQAIRSWNATHETEILSARREDAYGDEEKAGWAEFILLDGAEEKAGADSIAFSVKKGAPAQFPVLLVMGATREEFERNRQAWRPIDSVRLASETMDWFAARLGALRIEDEWTPLAAITRRAIYAQLITPFVDETGSPAGSSWGSCASEVDGNLIWMMDTFYNYLSVGLFDPRQYLDGIRFFLLRSVPSDEAVDFWIEQGTIPQERERLHSLGNLVAPVVLAGAYYAATGDGEGLKAIVETDDVGESVSFEARMVVLLEKLLASRAEGSPHLFESQWLSDGPTRGKYHTGSNMLAWYAFVSAARLLREVFCDEEKATTYGTFAGQMHQDIRTRCTTKYEGEVMFNEGLQELLIHDGEESGSTIAPCLGFCSADDAALLRYKQFAATPDNPLWSEEKRGIIWGGSGYITTPGYMSELAGAAGEDQLSVLMDKLCTLVDVDGQWWWWPLNVDEEEAGRGPTGMCGWGTSVYLLRLVHTNLGVDWDAPSKLLTIKPFVPWKSFEYDGLRVGALQLSLTYRASEKGVTIDILHNQPRLDALRLVVRVPKTARDCSVVRSSVDCTLTQGAPYFGKPAWELVFSDVTDPRLSVELSWTGDSEDGR